MAEGPKASPSRGSGPRCVLASGTNCSLSGSSSLVNPHQLGFGQDMALHGLVQARLVNPGGNAQRGVQGEEPEVIVMNAVPLRRGGAPIADGPPGIRSLDGARGEAGCWLEVNAFGDSLVRRRDLGNDPVDPGLWARSVGVVHDQRQLAGIRRQA